MVLTPDRWVTRLLDEIEVVSGRRPMLVDVRVRPGTAVNVSLDNGHLDVVAQKRAGRAVARACLRVLAPEMGADERGVHEVLERLAHVRLDVPQSGGMGLAALQVERDRLSRRSVKLLERLSQLDQQIAALKEQNSPPENA